MTPFLPCPVPGCAAPADVCATASGAMRFCATFLVEEITKALAHPGLPACSVAVLNRVDEDFGHLDALMRAGAHPPALWTMTSQTEPWTPEEITDLYDSVSEALRETGDVTVCHQALRTAGARWKLLHEALCSGAPLPEPWQRC